MISKVDKIALALLLQPVNRAGHDSEYKILDHATRATTVKLLAKADDKNRHSGSDYAKCLNVYTLRCLPRHARLLIGLASSSHEQPAHPR